jgi:pyroglutamyl-peptidase
MTQPATRRVVLVTGFEPFDGADINPSWEAARALDGTSCGAASVVARQMPCVFGAALVALEAAIAELQPELVICVGLAGGRSEMSLERVAINIDDGRIADNAGAQPIDVPVVAGGPAAYFSSLPIKAIVHALRDAGTPASVSNTAGTFVCNHIFYGLMHALARGGGYTRGGFIHIPYLPEQAAQVGDAPSMALETAVKGLTIAIETALSVHIDLRETGGRIS